MACKHIPSSGNLTIVGCENLQGLGFRVITFITCAFNGELISSWTFGKEGGVLTISLLQDWKLIGLLLSVQRLNF